MKIAVWHNLPSGGGKRALHHQIRGLVERGHRVEAWCPPTADADYLALRDLVPEHVVPLAPPGTLERRLPYQRKVGRLRRLDAHCRRCAAEIASRDFDVLFAGPCQISGAGPIARHLVLPSVLYLQEPARRLYECFPELPWRALPAADRPSIRQAAALLKDWAKVQGLRVAVREEWQSAKAFDRILVNSAFSRESVLRAYGLSAAVCYLGIDADQFRPKSVARERFVVSVGGLAFGKGAERAIRAIAAIDKPARPELVWIGNFEEPRYRAGIEALAAEQEVALRIRIGISDEELVDCLSRAAAMLYVPVLEPFGFAPLEAGACETPVVALAEGGVRESIRDGINGILVAGDEPAQLAAPLRELLDDPERARRLGKRARADVVAQWSWESACERLERELMCAASGKT